MIHTWGPLATWKLYRYREIPNQVKYQVEKFVTSALRLKDNSKLQRLHAAEVQNDVNKK